MSAFDRAEKSALTAVYEGHALATLPVAQDARARIAHGAPRARCPKPGDRAPSEHPVTKRVDGLAAFLDCASGDLLRTFRDWPDFVLPPSSQSLGRRQIKPVPRRDGFATAMCFARRRSLRRSRNAAIILPTTTVTPSLVRRPSFFDRFRKRRGGRHRSLGQRRLLRRTRSLRQHCPLSRARCHFAHRVGRRSLHTLSVVARFAHLPSRVSERYRGRDG